MVATTVIGPEDSGTTWSAKSGSGSSVTVPDAHLLFHADFQRDFSDLVLSDDRGQSMRITDYFSGEETPDLVTVDGAKLEGSLVEVLAGPAFPAQYAQATPTTGGAQPIGQVETVSGGATVQRADGSVDQLAVGSKVFQNDVVQTQDGGTLSITFSDGTIFTLASGSRMVLSELVYNPDGNGNSAVFNLVEGSFVFIAGQVAKTGGMEVNTPVATMGIRGTTVKVDLTTTNGNTTVEVSLNRDPDGSVGAITLTDLNGNLIANITGTDSKWFVSPVDGETREIARTADDLATDQVILDDAIRAFQSAEQRVLAGEQYVNPDSDTDPDGNNENPQDDEQPPSDDQPNEGQPDENTPEEDRRGELNDGGTELALATETRTDIGEGGDSSTQGLGESNGIPIDPLGTASVPGNSLPPLAERPPSEGNEEQQDDEVDVADLGPQVTLPVLTENVVEDGSISLAGFQVTDIGNDLLTATLIAGSTVSIDVSLGINLVSGTGTNDEQIVFEGTASQIDAVLNTIVYSPSPNDDDGGTLTIIITDGINTTTRVLNIGIDPQQDAPEAIDDAVEATANSPTLTGNLTDNDTDPDTGDVLSVASASEPDPSGGTPIPISLGQPHTLSGGGTITLNDDSSFTFDAGNAYENLGSGEVFVETIEYEVTDGQTSDTASLNITITGTNDAPTLSGTLNTNVSEGGSVTLAAASISGVDADDLPGDLTFTLTSSPANGHVELTSAPGTAITTFTQAQIDAGEIVYIHDGSETNGDSFSFSLADGGEDGAQPVSGTFAINVDPTNDAPSGEGAPTSADFQEGTPGSLDLSSLTLADPDSADEVVRLEMTSNGGALSATGTSLVAVVGGGTTLALEGSITDLTSYLQDTTVIGYAPSTGNSGDGVDTVSLVINDLGNSGSGGPLTASVGAISINVESTNQLPEIEATDFDPVTEGSPASAPVTLDLYDNVTLSDADAGDEPVIVETSISVVPAPGNPGDFSAAFSINGSAITIRVADFDSLAAGEQATYGVLFDVSSGPDVVSSSLNLAIVGTNDGPVIAGDLSVSVAEGGLVAITTDDLTGTDVDDDDAGLNYTVAAGLSHGVFELSTDPGIAVSSFTQEDLTEGLVFYRHDGSETSSDLIDLELTDGGEDGASAATASLSIGVNPTNDDPTGSPTGTLLNGTEDTAYIVVAADLLDGFSDVDGDTLSVAGLAASDGSVTDNGDGTFTVTPSADFNGTVTLTYDVEDGAGGTLTGQVLSYTVDPVNDDPTGSPAGTLTNGVEDIAYVVAAADLLDGFSDVDGDTLSVVNLVVSEGTVTDNGDGTFTVTPDADFNGPMTLTYDVDDGNGGGLFEESLSYTIDPVNDGPSVNGDFSIAVAEGGTIGITSADLAGIDVDDAAADLVYTITTAPELGRLELTTTSGAITSFTQAELDAGQVFYVSTGTTGASDSFVVSLADGGEDGASPAEATVSVAIGGINDDPSATGFTEGTLFAAGDEDSAIDLVVNRIDLADPDSGSGDLTLKLTVADGALAATAGASGVTVGGTATAMTIIGTLAELNAFLDNQTVSYTPPADVNGGRVVSVAVNDGGNTGTGGGADVALGNINVTINAVNDTPSGSPAAALANGTEDVAYDVTLIDLLDGFSDVDGDTLSVANLVASSGTVAANGSSGFTITPDADFNGPVTLTYDVVDGNGGSVTGQQLSYTVDAVNDAPVVSGNFALSVAEGGTVVITAASLAASDVDDAGLGLTFTVTTPPTLGQLELTSAGGTAITTFTHADLVAGDVAYVSTGSSGVNDSFVVSLADGGEDGVAPDTATLNVTIGDVNDDPLATGFVSGELAASGNEDSAIDLQIDRIDLIDPDSGSGDLILKLTVADGVLSGTAGSSGVTIGGTAIAMTVTGTLTEINNFLDTQSVTYTPPADFNGSRTVAVTANDGGNTGTGGGTDVALGNINVTVNSVNDDPAGTPTATLANGSEDTPYIVQESDLLEGITDIDSIELSVANLSSSDGSVTDNSDGTYTIIPTADFSGTVTLTYDVNDDQGGSLTGLNLTYSVDAVNDAPTGSPAAVLTNGTEDLPYDVTLADLLDGFSDVDGDTLSVANLTTSDGTVTPNGSTGFTITPSANFNGTVTLTYDVEDGNGGSLTGQQLSYTLDAVNDDPTGSPTATLANGTEDTAYIVQESDLLQGFSDVDSAELSVAGLSASDGSVVDNSDGTYTVTPSADFNGSVTLTYTIEDGNGGSLTGQQLSYTLNPVNDDPVGVDDSVTTDEDTSVDITIASLLSNDSDVDGDPLSLDNFSSPSNGTTVLDDNGTTGDNSDDFITYTPDADFNGADSFTYFLSDGSGATISTTVNVTVNPVNDDPLVNGLSAGTTYTESEVNSGFQIFDTDVTVIDVDSADFSGGSLSSFYVAAGLPEDQLGIVNSTTPGVGIEVSGSNVSFNGILIGEITSDGTNGSSLTIAFNQAGHPSQAATEALIESIGYSNISDTPTATRSLRATLEDGDGGTRTSFARTITVTAENDAPNLNVSSSGATAFTENDGATTIATTVTITDPDSTMITGATVSVNDGFQDGDVLDYSLTGPISGSYNATTGVLTLTGSDTFANYQTALQAVTFTNPRDDLSPVDREITYSVSDGIATSNIGAAIVDPQAVNDAPEIDLLNVVSGPELVTNGGLEDGPDVSPSSLITAGSGLLPGWTVVSGNIDHINGTFPTAYWNSASGDNSIDLHGTAQGVIQTSIATDIGDFYQISFDLAGDPLNGETIKDVRATFGATSQDFSFDSTGFTRADMGWTTHSFIVQATTVSTTLQFDSLDANSNSGPGLDNISVRKVESGTVGAIEDVPVEISNILISDIDELDGTYTVTLSADKGILTVREDVENGLFPGDITNNGTYSVTLIGSIDAINVTLAGAGAVTYASNLNFKGTDAISISVDDGGSSGAGGPQIGTTSLPITVTSVSDAPPSSSSIGDVVAGNVANLSGVQFVENTTTGSAGTWVANVGDVNNDGLEDFAIGAQQSSGDASGSPSNSGSAYVVYGMAGTNPFSVYANAAGEISLDQIGVTVGGFELVGAAGGDLAGASVAGGGDLNNDGIDDLVVGSPFVDGPLNAGSSFVIYGGQNFSGFTGAEGEISLDTVGVSGGLNGFEFRQNEANENLGQSVSIGGDLNNDGISDLIVGNPTNTSTGRGNAWVLFGGQDFASQVDAGGAFDFTVIPDTIDGFQLVGEAPQDFAGFSVDFIGDFNSDGIDDIVVGALQSDDVSLTETGAIYVIYGGQNWSNFTTGADNRIIELSSIGSTGPNGFKMSGADSNQFFGSTVASAGDVNNDGVDDLIVTSPDYGVGGTGQGVASLIYGSFLAPTGSFSYFDIGTTGLNGANFIGANSGDGVDSIASAGDINGDGLGDLLITSKGFDAAAVGGIGATYVVFGQQGQFSGTISLADVGGTGTGSVDGFRLVGENGNDFLGGSVSAAGDVNGDGYGDLLIGATGNDDGASGGGAGYLIYGGDFEDQVQFVAGASPTVGSNGRQFFMGTPGDDVIDGGGGGDAISAAGGDDTIIVGNTFFDFIDGGSGTDTLLLSSDDDLNFNLTNSGRINSIEALSIENGEVNDLTLSISDVFQFSDDANENLEALLSDTIPNGLIIDADVGDSITLESGPTGSWALSTTVTGYGIYEFTPASSIEVLATLAVDDDVVPVLT